MTFCKKLLLLTWIAASTTEATFVATDIAPKISTVDTTRARVEYDESFNNVPSNGVPFLVYGQESGKRVASFKEEIVENIVTLPTICEKLIDLKVQIDFNDENKHSVAFNFDPIDYRDMIKTETCKTEDNQVRVDVEELRRNVTFDRCVTVVQLFKSGGRNPEDQFGTDITNANIDINVTQSQFDIVYPKGDSGLDIELRGVKTVELNPCPVFGQSGFALATGENSGLIICIGLIFNLLQ